MKKIALFAAVAMLAFASCNKEENQVALNFGGEAYTSADKQAYESNRIHFTEGDVMLVNGETYNVNPTASNNGLTARVYVPGSREGYHCYYGEVAQDANGNITANFRDQINLVPMAGNTVLDAQHQVWPMSGFVASADDQLTLLHNVAIVTPAVKYGATFARIMWAANGIDAQEDYVVDPENLPELTFTKIEIASPNTKLTGAARLDESEVDYPVMVMTGATPTDNNPDVITCLIDPAYQAVPTDNDEIVGYRFGNIAVAPIEVGSRIINVTFYFSANVNGVVRNYKYTGTMTTNRNNICLRRATRLSFLANFYDQQANLLRNKITVLE